MENNSQPNWLETEEPKPLFDLSKRDAAFALCAIVICIFLSVWGLFGGFALGYTVTFLSLYGLFAFYFARCRKRSAFSLACHILTLANATVFLYTTNGSVRFFGFVVSLLLMIASLDGLVMGDTRGNRATADLFFRALGTMSNAGVAVKSLYADRNGNKKTVGKALIGLICAVPVLLVVLPLLCASDAAFLGMVNRFLTGAGSRAVNAGSMLLKVIFGAVISLFVISYGFCLKTGRIAQRQRKDFAGIENVYLVSFLSAISLCYLLYLFSQLAYFFSAFQGFLPHGGVTYAQYARKGFFEMCTIAVINLVLVFSAMLLARKQMGKVSLPIKMLATFIGAFTLLIIATAISKMVLYIDAYGMTVRRVTTSAFMVFLAIVFTSVILRIYIRQINIVKTALVAAGCIVLLLGTANVNRICAKYNYESYMTGKLHSVDIVALYELGDEGIPYIVRLADCKDPALAITAKQYLKQAIFQDYFNDVTTKDTFTESDLRAKERNNAISQFSLPRARAYKSLYQYLTDHPSFPK